MERVRHPRCDGSVTLRSGESALCKLRIIVGMDQVMNDAGMIRVLFPQLFQYAGRLKLFRQAHVVRRSVASSQHRKSVKGLHFKIVGILVAQLAHRVFVRDNSIARSDWPVTRLSNGCCDRTVCSVIIHIERRDESALAIRVGLDRHRLLNGSLARAHFIGTRRRPYGMPPGHGDSPLSHGALRIAFCDGGKNTSRLFIKKRVEQRYAASKIRLEVRLGRYRKACVPDAAQIARFGSGCAFEMSRRESRGEYDKKRYAPAMRAEHF